MVSYTIESARTMANTHQIGIHHKELILWLCDELEKTTEDKMADKTENKSDFLIKTNEQSFEWNKKALQAATRAIIEFITTSFPNSSLYDIAHVLELVQLELSKIKTKNEDAIKILQDDLGGEESKKMKGEKILNAFDAK